MKTQVGDIVLFRPDASMIGFHKGIPAIILRVVADWALLHVLFDIGNVDAMHGFGLGQWASRDEVPFDADGNPDYSGWDEDGNLKGEVSHESND